MNGVERGDGVRDDSEVLGRGDILTSGFMKNRRSCLKSSSFYLLRLRNLLTICSERSMGTRPLYRFITLFPCEGKTVESSTQISAVSI